MRRNYLKGRDGDRVNAVLAAAGYNFSLLRRWFDQLLRALLLSLSQSLAAAPCSPTLSLKAAPPAFRSHGGGPGKSLSHASQGGRASCPAPETQSNIQGLQRLVALDRYERYARTKRPGVGELLRLRDEYRGRILPELTQF